MKDNLIFFIAMVILILGIFSMEILSRQKEIFPKRALGKIPLALDGWRGRESKLEIRTLDILGVDDYISRIYTKDGFPLWVYVGYYASQKEGALIHSPRHCYPGAGWEILESSEEAIKVPPKEIIVNRLLLKRGLEEKVVFYWYRERKRIVTNEYKAKFFLIFDRIFRQRSNGALIEVSGPVFDSIEDSVRLEKEFIRLFYPVLEDYFPKEK